ncbi:hypothetical protein HanIR_Chr05g0232641 [Helianthus annuus]|nr:hypothetical protein HanIR_Chr05g0232641 [Helianthus annuus]
MIPILLYFSIRTGPKILFPTTCLHPLGLFKRVKTGLTIYTAFDAWFGFNGLMVRMQVCNFESLVN